MLNIKYSQFFDKPGVINKIKAGARGALSKAGAYIRQRAKTSIRKRKRPASPGSPPSSHTGRLRDAILFGYDERTDSVVVGPTKYKNSNPTGAELLEYGGTGKTAKGKAAYYHAFPFMHPAEAAERPHTLALFANCVK